MATQHFCQYLKGRNSEDRVRKAMRPKILRESPVKDLVITDAEGRTHVLRKDGTHITGDFANGRRTLRMGY